MEEKRICIVCGQEFIATNGMQKVCKRTHYDTCVVCGCKYEIPKSRLVEKDRARCCSKACSQTLRRKSCVEKYGGVAPACSTEVRAKMEATNEARYGVKHPAQSTEVQKKMQDTCLVNYGAPFYLATEDCTRKTREASMRKYGTLWPTQSSIVKAKTEATCLDRYGTRNPMQSNFGKTAFIQSHMQDSSKIDTFLAFKEDPAKFIEKLRLDHKPSLYELSHVVGVNTSTIGKYLYEHDCKDLVAYQVSVMEQEVKDFILSVVPDIKIEMNVHNIITPNELDIWLPEYRIGVECNPTATHNSTVNVFDRGDSCMYPRYHLDKTLKCQDNNIFLFHIFGSEWTYNRPIIESMIRNLLGKNLRKVYARKCVVREIDPSKCREFLDANHRQGNVNSPIRLGLFLDDELVSVMTFGKMRSSIGTDNTDLSDCWELVRFCSLLNTTVVGGADKLFKYFTRNYSPVRIRSFSDRAHTRGGLYEKLGFVPVRESDPGYVWVDSRTDISYHRYSAQKQHIKQFLHDDNVDLSKTEKQIMEEHGFLQMYDCGTITWEWRCSQPCIVVYDTLPERWS